MEFVAETQCQSQVRPNLDSILHPDIMYKSQNQNQNQNQIQHDRKVTPAQENYYTFLQTFLLHYNYRRLHRVVCETSLEVSEPMYSLLTKELESPNKHMWGIIFDRSENQDLLLYYYLFYKKNMLPSISITTTTATTTTPTLTDRSELSYTYPKYIFQIYNQDTPFLHQLDSPRQLYSKYTYVDFVNYALEESFKRSSVTEHMHFVNRIKSGNMLNELTEKHREHSFLCDVKNNIILGIHCLIKSIMYPYNEKYNMPDLNILSYMNYCLHNDTYNPTPNPNPTNSTYLSPEEVYIDLEKKVFNEIQIFIK